MSNPSIRLPHNLIQTIKAEARRSGMTPHGVVTRALFHFRHCRFDVANVNGPAAIKAREAEFSWINSFGMQVQK